MSGSELANALSGGNLLTQIAHPQGLSPNLLTAYGQGQDIAAKVWQNRNYLADQSVGQAFQQSIGPDGTPNQPKLNALLAADPRAALAAQRSSQAGQNLDNSSYQTQQARLAQMTAAQMALAAQHPTGVPADAAAAELDRLGPQFGLGPTDIARMKSNLDPTNPMANTRLILRNSIAHLQQLDAMHASTPGYGSVDQGPNIQPTQQAPIAAGPGAAGVVSPVGAPIPLGLSPAAGAGRTSTIDNNQTLPNGQPNPNYGQPITVPLSSTVAPPGSWGPGAARPGAAPGAGGAAPSPANPPRLPGAAAAPPPGQAAPGQQASAAPSVPGSLPSALPPGAAIPIEAANNAWAAANNDTSTYAARMFPVTQALALAKSGVTTGQGAEQINNIKSWLQTRASSFGWNAQTIANSNFQELGKYLQQVVNSQPMAAGSDARMASALAGNPSAHLNNLSLADTLTAGVGMMRMQQMAAVDFAAQGAPNGQWHNFLRSWQTSHDPRAFIADAMDPKKQEAMIKGMSVSERAAFARTLNLIDQHPDIMNTAAMPH